MAKILVTGANGMLGQDFVPLAKSEGFVVIATDLHNMNITDIKQVKTLLQEEKPDYIVHGAAYTNVDGAESDRKTAFQINNTGSGNLAEISGLMRIPMFAVSTDYVFDGTKEEPYVPDDEVNPINVYGCSKLAGEISVKMNNPRHYILRTSWLYGHKGKNFVETMIRLAGQNGELRVVADQVGCPTWTMELSSAILRFIKEGKPYGTYHVCGSGNTSWHGFAEKIMELMDIKVPVKPLTTEEFPTPAARPMNSIMDNAGVCPQWEESLVQYIKLRSEKLLCSEN